MGLSEETIRILIELKNGKIMHKADKLEIDIIENFINSIKNETFEVKDKQSLFEQLDKTIDCYEEIFNYIENYDDIKNGEYYYLKQFTRSGT